RSMQTLASVPGEWGSGYQVTLGSLGSEFVAEGRCEAERRTDRNASIPPVIQIIVPTAATRQKVPTTKSRTRPLIASPFRRVDLSLARRSARTTRTIHPLYQIFADLRAPLVSSGRYRQNRSGRSKENATESAAA